MKIKIFQFLVFFGVFLGFLSENLESQENKDLVFNIGFVIAGVSGIIGWYVVMKSKKYF